MPRDQRLYMTFPIDFDEHPKIELLSDPAFRAFVAMNGYCRRQRLDGKIPAAIATKRWGRKVLGELLASHDERPLVLLEDDTYVLRSYADHQFTTADEEALRSARAIAGAKGGKSKANALAIAKQTAGNEVAGSESGLGISLTDTTRDPESGPVVDAGEGLDHSLVTLVSEKIATAATEAKRLGVNDMWALHGLLETAAGKGMTAAGAVQLVGALLTKTTENIRDVDAYIATICRTDAQSVADMYFNLDIGDVA